MYNEHHIIKTTLGYLASATRRNSKCNQTEHISPMLSNQDQGKESLVGKDAVEGGRD